MPKNEASVGTSLLRAGLVAAGILGVAIGANKVTATPKPLGRIEQLVNEYRPYNLKKVGQTAFIQLVTLTPREVTANSLKERVTIAKTIKTDIDWFTLSLLGTGKDYGNHVDEVDLAAQIIPRQTQTALKDHSIKFVPLQPPPCNYNGDQYPYINPYDYSNHAPSQVEVQVVHGAGQPVVEVPLGAAQEPMSQPDVAPPAGWSYYNEAMTDPLISISQYGPFIPPCSDYPQIGGLKPNGQLQVFQDY
jgi:hypothetical protein